jgi:hypothetical protein
MIHSGEDAMDIEKADTEKTEAEQEKSLLWSR